MPNKNRHQEMDSVQEMYCTQFKQQLAFEELTFITKPSYFHSFSRICAPSLLTSFFSLVEIYIDGHIDKTPSNTRVQKDKYFNWKNRSKKGDPGGGGRKEHQTTSYSDDRKTNCQMFYSYHPFPAFYQITCQQTTTLLQWWPFETDMEPTNYAHCLRLD